MNFLGKLLYTKEIKRSETGEVERYRIRFWLLCLFLAVTVCAAVGAEGIGMRLLNIGISLYWLRLIYNRVRTKIKT